MAERIMENLKKLFSIPKNEIFDEENTNENFSEWLINLDKKTEIDNQKADKIIYWIFFCQLLLYVWSLIIDINLFDEIFNDPEFQWNLINTYEILIQLILPFPIFFFLKLSKFSWIFLFAYYIINFLIIIVLVSSSLAYVFDPINHQNILTDNFKYLIFKSIVIIFCFVFIQNKYVMEKFNITKRNKIYSIIIAILVISFGVFRYLKF